MCNFIVPVTNKSVLVHTNHLTLNSGRQISRVSDNTGLKNDPDNTE